MRSSHRFALPLLAVAALTAPRLAAATARPYAPAGSFLHRLAHSVTQLTQEVQADPIVRRRFARHFHIPEREVADNFRRNFLTGTLPRSGTFTVYFVTGTGLIYPTRMDLHAGTPVFVGRGGLPVLLAGSGDPLRPFTTPVEERTIEGKPDAPPSHTKEEIAPAAGTDIPVPTTPTP